MLTVMFFGQLKEKAGVGTLEVEDACDTEQLLSNLSLQFPSLKESPFVVAVDKKITVENTSLKPGATIALLPPYSGG